MYNVSTQFNAKALDINRNVYLKLTVNGTVVAPQNIISLTYNEGLCNDNIQLGTTQSQYIKFKFIKPNGLALQGATVRAYISFDNEEWCPIGVFRVIECPKTSEYYEVTAYDTMAFLEDEYVPRVTAPTTVASILNDICTQKGITIKGNIPTISVSELFEGTIRSTIGYMAGLMGRNAIINREGQLEFRWFSQLPTDPSSAICGTAILGQAVVGNAGNGNLNQDNVYESGFTEGENVTISSLISGTSETPITSGSGKYIEFYNPYMTQARLDAIKNEILPFTYYGGEIKYRGNPAYEVGDICNVALNEGTYQMPIMSQEFEYDGGLYANITSLGLSNEKIAVSQANPIRQEIERNVGAVLGELEAVNNSLVNVTGGYLELLYGDDTNGKTLRGFRIMDTPTVTPLTKGWVANLNGIGWSNNGFASISKLGLSMVDGKIYADNISANAIISNHFTCQDLAITGGSINISTLADTTDVITLTHGSVSATFRPEGFIAQSSAYQTKITFAGVDTPSVSTSAIAPKTANTSLSIGLFASDVSLGADTKPLANNTYDLGNASAYWKVVHTNNVQVHSQTTVSNTSVGYGTVGGVLTGGFYVQRYSGSSKRHKHDIESLNEEWLNNIRKLYDVEVKRWKYNEDYLDPNDELFGVETLGVIAEELNEALPTTIIHDGEEIDNYRDRDLMNAMLVLIQEQHKEIEELKERING